MPKKYVYRKQMGGLLDYHGFRTQTEDFLNSLDGDISAANAKIGNLNDLTTADKSSVVAAINEAAQSGGGGETAVEHSMSLLTGQAIPQMMGGNQHMTSSVQFYSETDYNKWLTNPADPSISSVTVVSYRAPETVEFFPIDFSQVQFQPYAISAKVYLPNSQSAVQTYNPNAPQHGSRPEPVVPSSSPLLLPAYWLGIDGLAEDNPSGFYFTIGTNEETGDAIFKVVQKGDSVLQSVVTVNGVTATARVDLAPLLSGE